MRHDNQSEPAGRSSGSSTQPAPEIGPLTARTILLSEGPTSVEDLRTQRRHTTNGALTVIPVAPDGQPDANHRFDARCLDLSIGGIGLEFSGHTDVPSENLLICSRWGDGTPRFCEVSVRHTRLTSEGGLRTGGQFGGLIQEVLDVGQIVPTFRPETMEFAHHFPRPFLDTLVAARIVQPVVIDRIQVCPQCGALPTFRQGCRKCGSANVSADRLIHHFACAYAGPVAEFETPQGLVCPKCRTKHIVAGADFEYLTGLYQCGGCHRSDSELEQVGLCLRCGFHFPVHHAALLEVIGFHAHRLDPLDFITSC